MAIQPRPHTMYKVQLNGKTMFLGRMGDCWSHLRDQVGSSGMEEIKAAGWRVIPARASKVLLKTLEDIA